jgi:hypothetical protein
MVTTNARDSQHKAHPHPWTVGLLCFLIAVASLAELTKTVFHSVPFDNEFALILLHPRICFVFPSKDSESRETAGVISCSAVLKIQCDVFVEYHAFWSAIDQPRIGCYFHSVFGPGHVSIFGKPVHIYNLVLVECSCRDVYEGTTIRETKSTT